MGWAGFDGGVGGEGGSHALRAQGSNGDAHGRCALRNGSPLANRLRTGQRPPEEKAPPKKALFFRFWMTPHDRKFVH